MDGHALLIDARADSKMGSIKQILRATHNTDTDTHNRKEERERERERKRE